MQTIDIHAHFFPESWPDLAVRFGSPDWPWIKHLGDGKAMIMLGNREFRRIKQVCWDPTLRLEDLDRRRVDLQVISATPVLFSYDRPAEQALEVARIFNDAALEMCSHANGRLKSLCQVPLQDIDASCAELSRCMHAGHIGVQIGNHVGPKNLDDPGIITFLHHCADIGAPVLVHPWDMMATRPHAELHDALDGCHAGGDSARNFGAHPQRRLRPPAEKSCAFASLMAAEASRICSAECRTPGSISHCAGERPSSRLPNISIASLSIRPFSTSAP